MRRGARGSDKAALLARMPHLFVRPKLRPDQLVDLGLCHHANFEAIVQGSADAEVMWHYVESVLTWWRVAQAIGAGQDEMAPQLEIATRLVERYSRTGRVRFDGLDLQAARLGVGYMDDLAALVDRPNAIAASTWANAEVNRMIAVAAAANQTRGQPA